MTRYLPLVALVLSAPLTAAASPLGSLRDRTPPSAPAVSGPRDTTAVQPAYVFRSRDRVTPVKKLRYLCAFDSPHLHACAARYSETLETGAHVLRVRAVDRAGNRSRVTTVSITVRSATSTEGDLKPTASIDIGGIPRDVAFGFGSVWVADAGTGSLIRVDTATNAIVARIAVGGARAVAAGAGAVWTANPAEDRVLRIDPATNSVVASIFVQQAATIAAGAEGVWANGQKALGEMRLARIDPATNTVSFLLDENLPGGPVAVGGGYAWVRRGDDLLQIDPATNAVVRTGSIVNGAQIAYGPSGLWSRLFELNPLNPFLVHVDAGTLTPKALTTTGRPRCTQGGGLAVGPATVMVVDNCLVDIVDAVTGTRLHELVTTHNLSGGAFGAGSFWVVDVDAAKLLRFDSG